MELRANETYILGTKYTIEEDSPAKNPKLINNNAYVELWSKKIVFENNVATIETLENLDELTKKSLRHEVIHSMFHESGLKSYCQDEVLVDWIALQFGKLSKIFNELGIEEKQ